MTTLSKESVVCGSCGNVFTHHALMSTNCHGFPDLDGRPPEMQRSTMHTWIQRCPTCGNCSHDASQFDGRFRRVIDCPSYRSQLADARYPELASSFACAAMLAEADEQLAVAGRAYLHAAWTLDDAGKDDLARDMRSKAADLFLGLAVAGHSIAEQPGESEAILTDCLRRSGRGAEALQVVERAMQQSLGDILRKVLLFQQTLVQRGDTGGHSVKEAIEPK